MPHDLASATGVYPWRAELKGGSEPRNPSEARKWNDCRAAFERTQALL